MSTETKGNGDSGHSKFGWATSVLDQGGKLTGLWGAPLSFMAAITTMAFISTIWISMTNPSNRIELVCAVVAIHGVTTFFAARLRNGTSS